MRAIGVRNARVSSVQIFESFEQSHFDFMPAPWSSGPQAGVDEVGIGPLAGPVVAGAVVLDPQRPIDALADSKTLTAKKREMLAEEIRDKALSWSLGWASVAEIDDLNILRASHLAMQRAYEGLTVDVGMVLVDGNKTPQLAVPCVALVGGDKRIPQISAAAILAKVARDAAMADFDRDYPGYGFARHKGYPTKAHFQALAEHGATDLHRRSFTPVREALAREPAQRPLLNEAVTP